MKKRILIITDNLASQINGVVTTFKNIELLAKKDNYEISYIDPSFFKYISTPKYPEVKLSYPKNIGRIIESKHPNYIHIATEGPIGLFARFYLDRVGKKYNTSYHTKFPEFIKKIYGIPESITYSYVRWFHKHSGKVLTTTDTMVKELIENNFKGKIISWTRGVDRNYLLPTNDTRTISNNQKLQVLYVGRISKEKNLDELCKLEHKYDIVIVGDGPYKNSLEKKYQKVRFVGYKSGSDLADYYQNADVFCFPSKSDTFGIVMIESMSLGTPVAAYNVSGPIDVVEQTINGFMDDDLEIAIERASTCNRDIVKLSSLKWTWENCWEIFKNNLIEIY